MDPVVVQQLIDLNRRFYEEQAAAFAVSRTAPLPGGEHLLAYVPSDSALLDVGCGNAQLAVALDRLGRRVRYVGVDSSRALLMYARQATAALSTVTARFLELDVLAPGWTAAVPERPYAVVAALALLHHVPGRALRLNLLRDLASCVIPDGVLLLSTWQFLRSPRLRRRLVPWERVGLHADDVGPEDYLLDWRRGGEGLRYCAWLDEARLRDLAETVGLTVVEMFTAGPEDINLCAVLRCPA